MSNMAVNAVTGTLCPLGGIDSQSIYDYFAGNRIEKARTVRSDGLTFSGIDDTPRTAYRVFRRNVEGGSRRPYYRMMNKANAVLTAWQSPHDKEPTEFQLLDLGDMSQENIAWLRADGEVNLMVVDKAEKLLAMAYHDEHWRIDIRRSDSFQLREVIRHAMPVSGLFFHNDVLFSLSNKLVASYPEDRRESVLVCSGSNVLGWAHHPSDPYMIIVETDSFRIIDLDSLRVVKEAAWTDAIRWFNILQRYSNHNMEQHLNKSTAVFSKDGNRLLLGGYGRLAVFNWHDMLRPRCEQPEPEKIIDIHPEKYSPEVRKSPPDSHIIDMACLNRDRVLCVTAAGYLSLVNIRSDETALLLKPGIGVRINSVQLDSKGKYLAMTGYHYDFDGRECKVDTALMLWKMSRLINKSSWV
ncbi:MAG: hypothetical protein PHV59_02075 [Victivallales bacterium]|nr:hypothetical protein [Victivallales bacterium]